MVWYVGNVCFSFPLYQHSKAAPDTTSRKDLGVPEIDRKELEEFIDAIPEIPVIVRDNIKEDARIKAFDLKKRMLYDIKEFGEDNEGE